jgi:hypothetical protein
MISIFRLYAEPYLQPLLSGNQGFKSPVTMMLASRFWVWGEIALTLERVWWYACRGMLKQFMLLHSVTHVRLRLITVLGNCDCVAVASFLGVPSPLEFIYAKFYISWQCPVVLFAVCQLQPWGICGVFAMPTNTLLLNILPAQGLGKSSGGVCAQCNRARFHHAYSGEFRTGSHIPARIVAGNSLCNVSRMTEFVTCCTWFYFKIS